MRAPAHPSFTTTDPFARDHYCISWSAEGRPGLGLRIPPSIPGFFRRRHRSSGGSEDFRLLVAPMRTRDSFQPRASVRSARGRIAPPPQERGSCALVSGSRGVGRQTVTASSRKESRKTPEGARRTDVAWSSESGRVTAKFGPGTSTEDHGLSILRRKPWHGRRPGDGKLSRLTGGSPNC